MAEEKGMNVSNDSTAYSWCLMLVRLNDQNRAHPAEAAKVLEKIRAAYMQEFKTPPKSTPGGFCEGAVTGPYDFYALFKFNSDGPIWLAARLRETNLFAEVITMNATPLERFRGLFK